MSNTLEIKLMGKAYRVTCEPAQRDALLAAVALLEDRFRETAEKTKGSGERLAVMAALNLAHELIAARSGADGTTGSPRSESIQDRIDTIATRIDESLTWHGQLL